jgi:hypothetical protein
MSKRLSLILAVALSLPLATIAPAKAQSYPLTCQIGQQNQVYFLLGYSAAAVTFQQANAPASSGVQPGFCAWADRAFHPGELSCLNVLSLGSIPILGLQNGRVSRASFDGSTPGKILNQAINGPTKSITFMVANNGGAGISGATGNCFQITNVLF